MEGITLHNFLEALSSKEPVPGGGGASAAAGAMSTALGMMVANLTTGKKKYKEAEEDIKRLLGKGKMLLKELEMLIDKDAEVFEPLSRAYGLPQNTEEEKKKKEEIMEAALFEASMVPLTIMERILEVMDIHEELSEKGSRLAMSDVGVGILFAQSALEGASLNVFINTKMMKDHKKAEYLNGRADAIIEKGRVKSRRIYVSVLEKIRPALSDNELDKGQEIK